VYVCTYTYKFKNILSNCNIVSTYLIMSLLIWHYQFFFKYQCPLILSFICFICKLKFHFSFKNSKTAMIIHECSSHFFFFHDGFWVFRSLHWKHPENSSNLYLRQVHYAPICSILVLEDASWMDIWTFSSLATTHFKTILVLLIPWNASSLFAVDFRLDIAPIKVYIHRFLSAQTESWLTSWYILYRSQSLYMLEGNLHL